MFPGVLFRLDLEGLVTRTEQSAARKAAVVVVAAGLAWLVFSWPLVAIEPVKTVTGYR